MASPKVWTCAAVHCGAVHCPGVRSSILAGVAGVTTSLIICPAGPLLDEDIPPKHRQVRSYLPRHPEGQVESSTADPDGASQVPTF